MEAGGKVQHLNQTCGGGGGKREEKKPLGRKNAGQSVEEEEELAWQSPDTQSQIYTGTWCVCESPNELA